MILRKTSPVRVILTGFMILAYDIIITTPLCFLGVAGMKRAFLAAGIAAVTLFYCISAIALESLPIGWASYNDLGCNGTTGGAGGPVYTVTNEADFATYASSTTPGPLTVQVQGTINLTARVDISPNKTIIGIGDNPTLTGYNIRVRGQDSGGVPLGYNVIIRNLILRNHSGGDSDGIVDFYEFSLLAENWMQ
jgi:pectate lyase